MVAKRKFAQQDSVVFGRNDFEAQLEMVTEVANRAGDRRLLEVRIQCVDHLSSGVNAMYEDGLIVFGCHDCGKYIGQVELAEVARPWGSRVLN